MYCYLDCKSVLYISAVVSALSTLIFLLSNSFAFFALSRDSSSSRILFSSDAWCFSTQTVQTCEKEGSQCSVANKYYKNLEWRTCVAEC